MLCEKMAASESEISKLALLRGFNVSPFYLGSSEKGR